MLAIVETREQSRGREPGTVYLRARAALVAGRESPRVIAQRVSPVAMASLGDFPELELLAAQAWEAAGETRLALPFARDLVASPKAHDDLRAAAEAILRAPRVPLEAAGTRDFEAAPEGGLRPITVPPPSNRGGVPPPSRPAGEVAPVRAA